MWADWEIVKVDLPTIVSRQSLVSLSYQPPSGGGGVIPAIFPWWMSFIDKFFTLKSTCHLERPQAGSPGASTQPWPLRWGWWGKGDLHPKFQESSFQKVHRHRANISNHVHVLQRQPRGSLTSWMGGKMESRASRKVIPVAFPSFLLTFQLLNMGMWMLDYASLRWAWRPWQPNYSWSSWCRLSHPWWSCGSMQHCG